MAIEPPAAAPESAASRSRDSSVRWTRTITGWLAILILVPSLWGFGSKFIEFVALARGDVDGLFAVSPLANYLLASLGFFCLMCWAALNGMFRDIEQPKRAMLLMEEELDRRERTRPRR